MRQPSAFPWIRAAILGGLCLQLGSTTTMAAGFSIPEASALGTGMSNAVVANPEEKGAFAYNPAAMGFHDRTSVSLGALFIEPSFSVDTATGHHAGAGADWVAAPLSKPPSGSTTNGGSAWVSMPPLGWRRAGKPGPFPS